MNNETIVETAEDIQRQIDELEKKRLAAMEKEEAEEVEWVEMPVADMLVQVAKNTVPKKNITPAEAAILTAMHHKEAGGSPLSHVQPTGKMKVDPLALKGHLVRTYGAAKVEQLFPGPNPNFPKSFGRAISIGSMMTLAPERMMDFHVKPMAAG